jgi:hypothetical protein
MQIEASGWLLASFIPIKPEVSLGLNTFVFVPLALPSSLLPPLGFLALALRPPPPSLQSLSSAFIFSMEPWSHSSVTPECMEDLIDRGLLSALTVAEEWLLPDDYDLSALPRRLCCLVHPLP